jgi:hypothetical protein
MLSVSEMIRERVMSERSRMASASRHRQNYWACEFHHRVNLLRNPEDPRKTLVVFPDVLAIIAFLGVFIAGCGGTRVMEIVTIYLGGHRYWGRVAVLVITTIASLTTSAVLVDVLPHPHKWVPQDGF